MNNCKQCGKEIEQTPGRRKRETCSDSCRQIAWQKKKKEDKLANVVIIPKEKYEEMTTEMELAKAKIKEFMEKPFQYSGQRMDIGTIQEAKTPDENISTETTQDKINKLKGELALINGKSDFANQSRRSLEKKIHNLEKVL